MSQPYAVPTAATHLWRSPSKTLEEGDGVVLVFPDGSKRHGIAVSEDSKGEVTFQVARGEWVKARIEWEDAP